MLSQLPINIDRLNKQLTDQEILRAGMIAELDAISFYEQMAAMTGNRKIKAVLLDIAREEKTHVGEFEQLLWQLDREQVDENKKAKVENKKLINRS